MISTISSTEVLSTLRDLPVGKRQVLFAGWPRSGKTSLAKAIGAELGLRVRHTDDLVPTHGWSELSQAVSDWFYEPGDWIVEGTPVARALRKWLGSTGEAPADLVVLFREPLMELTKGQAAMGKGSDTVWAEIEQELVRRGVAVRLVTSVGAVAHSEVAP